MEWRKTLQSTREMIQEMYDFILQYKLICDAHTVDFFSENHWDHIIPEEWKVELVSINDDASCFLNPEKLPHSKLKEFLCRAKQLKLSLHEVPIQNLGVYDASSIQRFGMTEKKAHEVMEMALYINNLITPLGICQIIDIGSGKGYLSECLSFTRGFRVYGIDSETVNRNGALDRCRKVEKYFKGKKKDQSKEMLKNKEDQSGIEEISDALNTATPSITDSYCGQLVPISTVSVAHMLHSSNQIVGDECNEDTELFKTISHHTHAVTHDTKIDLTVEASYVDTLRPKQNNTQAKDKDSDVTPEANSFSPVNDDSSCLITDIPTSFMPLTHFIDPEDNILSVIENSSGQLEPTALVGLHTCGDLACTGLKQFVERKPLQAMCIVGCCYNHITEEGNLPGFPMSEYLKTKNAVLGRTTRMLSCQSEGRFTQVTSGQALQSVFFRALLQVVLKEEMKVINNEEDARTKFVGRIKNFKGFIEYSRKAFHNLHIPLDQQPSDEILEKYHHLYLPRMIEIQCYVQIRAVLAPVIESFILMDRLLYLYENQVKSGIENAWVVQLFSPVLSPRCFALCGIKNRTV